MNNRIDALLLLKQIREQLQSNHGMEKENLQQALIRLDEGIKELESRRAGYTDSYDWILNLIAKFVEALPCIIELFNKYLE